MYLRSMLSILVLWSITGIVSAQQTAPVSPDSPVAPPWSSPVPVASDQGPAFPALDSPPANGSSERVWVDAEYLLWWMRGDTVPALLTSSTPGTPRSQAGILGAPDTAVMFGDSRTDGDLRSGFRFTTGLWLNDEDTFGIEGSFFMLEGKAARYSTTSNGSTILARPFTDATTGQQQASLIAFPGVASGDFNGVDASSGLIGAGMLLRANLYRDGNWRVDMLGGYRYLSFADRIGISENLTSLSNSSSIVPGTAISSYDAFSTKNQFNGFDAGFDFQYRRDRLSLDLVAKLAVGPNEQSVDINGSTTTTVPGSGSATSTGGFLALPSNIGHYSYGSNISVVPETEFKIGYQLTQHMQISLGYDVLYWSDVVRAGNQIDTTVNPNLLPPAVSPASGPSRPEYIYNRTSLLAQGFNLGFEIRY